MKIYGVIPAREGSKAVPKKNIKLLGGYPLIAYSIVASRLSKGIERTIVSTDSQQIAEIAISYGAEAPFLRPAELAQDQSGDLEWIQHLIEWFKSEGQDIPDLLVQLRPTTPLRDPREVNRAVDCLCNNSEATSLRSAHPAAKPVEKLFHVNDKGFFKSMCSDPRSEYYDLPRQNFPVTYDPNGYVDIIRTDCVQENKMLHGHNILAFLTDRIGEVDTLDDFKYLEYEVGRSHNPVREYLKKNFPMSIGGR